MWFLLEAYAITVVAIILVVAVLSGLAAIAAHVMIQPKAVWLFIGAYLIVLATILLGSPNLATWIAFLIGAIIILAYAAERIFFRPLP
jgi:hypothetical protein